jgi:diaminopropionate ammonia-lyase
VSRGIDVLVAVDDEPAQEAMSLTAASGIVSGETGAAGLGGLLELLRRGGESPDQEEKARRALGVGAESRVLLFNCEGATDPDRYRELVGGARLARKPPEGEA